MKIRASTHVVGALALMSVLNCQAFTPTSISTPTNNKPSFGLFTTSFQSKSVSSSSQLNMGIMEDFLAGTDKETRKKENESYLAALDKRVANINALEESVEDLGDDELMAKTAEFRKRLADGEDINGPILEEAFAVVREAAWYVSLFFSLTIFHLLFYWVEENVVISIVEDSSLFKFP